MTFQVILLPRADEDVQTIFAYIHERSPAGARSWHDRFEKVLDALRSNPTIYGAAPENEQYEDWFIQQVIFSTRSGNPYRTLFIVQEQTVNILYIRGFGQNEPPDLDDIELP